MEKNAQIRQQELSGKGTQGMKVEGSKCPATNQAPARKIRGQKQGGGIIQDKGDQSTNQRMGQGNRQGAQF